MELVGKNEPTQGKQNVNINIAEQPDVKCTNCDGIYFENAIRFKKVSKLLTAAPEDQLAPIQIFRCMDCGTPCEELMPQGL
jgi:DNA-directed RNA polymerase subunit RPC12/RpoP